MIIPGSNEPRIHNPSDPLYKSNLKDKKLVILVALDGTLAYYKIWAGKGEIGEPIQSIKKLILQLIEEGNEIRIFTERAQFKENIPPIRKWLLINGFPWMKITNKKEIDVDFILDYKAREVIFNTGIICDRCKEFNKERKNK